MARFNFEVDEHLHADVQARAESEGISMTALILRALRRELLHDGREAEQEARIRRLEDQVAQLKQGE